MADQRQQKVVSEVGHFYYDWALSRYRWTNDRYPCKSDGLPLDKVVPALCEVKDFVKEHSGSSMHVEIKNKRKESVEEEMKPLQDIDVNQIPCGRHHHSQDNLNANVISKQGPILNKEHVSKLPLTSRDAQEVAKGHGTMINVLQTRLLRLRAAQTLWHKDTNALIEYLLRLKDDGVLVDVMPFLTSRVREVSAEGYALSMGACLEMLPALERLLTSKFEDYIISGLNMIREMIKRWWLQLKVATNKGGDPELYRCSRSVSGLYMAIVSLSAIIVKLTKRRGRVGEKALVVTRLLDLL